MPPNKQIVTVHTCSTCSLNIKENQASLMCASCRAWVHHKCTSLSTKEFNEIARITKKNGPTWKCDSCKSEVSIIIPEDAVDTSDDNTVTMNKINDLFEKKLQSFAESLADSFAAKFDRFKTSIEGNVASIRDEVGKIAKQNNTLTDKCTRLNNRIASVEEKLKSHPDLSVSTEDIIAELAERKKRQSNVIAMNVAESIKVDGQDRLEEDRTKVLAALPPSLASNTMNFRIRRLGRPLAGRTRPLLIATPSPDDALTILKWKSTAEAEGPQITFKSDLTQAQQQHLKNLRAELDALIKGGDLTKTIKYINGIPKIVTKNFRPLTKKNPSNSADNKLSEREGTENKTKQVPNIVVSQ